MPELTVEKIILEISNSDEVVVLEVSSASGDGGVSIDDNAGLGVIDKTWSANKIKTEIGNVGEMFNTLDSTVDDLMITVGNNTQDIIDVNTRIDNIVPADITQAMFDALESQVDINTAAIPNKVDKEAGKGLSSNDFSNEDKTKLDSVATGATANATDDFLLDRGNHTGVQPIASVDGLQLALEALESDVSTLSTGKVDKDGGKQLSDENFTLIEKNKLLSIQEGAQANTVDSVAGKAGVVVLDKADVGLSNVDNTSDLNKPISNPTQAALDNKVDKQVGKGLSDTNFTQAEKDKLSSLEGSKFVGLFVSEGALPLSGSEGDYANVDGGVGIDVYRVIWDSSDNKWVKMQGVSTDLTPAQIKQQYESNPDTNAFTDDEKAKLDSVDDGATANRDDTLNADKVHSHIINDVVGLVEQLDLKAPISDTITRAEYQLLFAKVASVETLLMSLVGSIYVT